VSVGDGIEIAARFALIRRDRAGQLVSVHAVGCNSLGGPDFAIESEGRHRGDVTAVDAAARTVTVAGFPLTDALVGQSVLFANELHQTNFQVESVSGGDGKVVLGLGYVSPMIGHGTVYDVDDQNRVLLTDTTFRNYGCQDIWSKGFDPKLEGMYLLNGDRSKHFLINDCQLFPDVSKEWWQPEADHGSFNLAGTEKLSDTFKKGGEWYVQALWPGDVAWVENALVLQVQGQQVYRLSTTSTHIVLKVGKADGKVVYKATGATPGVHTVTAKDGRVELGAAMLQSGEGIVILNPNPRVDYSDCDPPRLVEMSADGKAVQYEKGMAPAAGGARQVRLVFGDANSLEPPTIAIAGVAVPATGRGVKTEKLTKATTAITLDLQALAAWAAAKEIAYPPVLQVAVRDSALNPEPCAVSLTLAALAAPGEGAIFLSDLKPVSSLAHAGLKNDRNYAGEPGVNLRGRHFDKAIMTCPETGHAAETIYDLASHPDHRIFQAVVGLDDAVGTRGTAAFEVYVDGPDDGWQKLHATRVLSGGGDVLALRIDLGQAKKLRLVVTEGGDGIGSDHAVWADARLELGD